MGGASLPEMLMSSLLSQGLKFSTCIQGLSPFNLLIDKLWVEHSRKWVLTVWKVPLITPRWGFVVSLRCLSYTLPVLDAFWELCNLTWLSIKKVWECLVPNHKNCLSVLMPLQCDCMRIPSSEKCAHQDCSMEMKCTELWQRLLIYDNMQTFKQKQM